MKKRSVVGVLPVFVATALLVAASSEARAGAHTWDVNEVFSNADGTIQFVEIREANGGAGETGVGGANIVSNTRTYDIPSNVVSPTTFKTILFGTPAFCALFNQGPGNPTCDFTFTAGQVPFFATAGDNVRYSPYDSWLTGVVPTNGVDSLNRIGTPVAQNSPKNYLGLGSPVDASPPPAGVPDGTTGSAMTVAKLDAAASQLSISFDTTTCGAQQDHQILYGTKSQLPTSLAGAYTLTGSTCGLGPLSPYSWSSVPDAGDGSGLLWWLVVVKKGSDEGPWGDSTAGERVGPGTGGSSGQCGVTNKNVANACGH